MNLEELPGACKKLIVNADDFGLTEKVNQAIIKGHQQGIITSTSLLANGIAFDSAVALAKQFTSLGVGVHINLTEGVPLSAPLGLQGLVNPAGSFRLKPVPLARCLLSGAIKPSSLEVEMRAQIERLLAAGIRPTHVDSHKHIHLFPAIFRVLMKLAVEYGINGIRCVRERVAHLNCLIRRHRGSFPRILKQYSVGFTLSLLCKFQRPRLRRTRLRFPAYCFGITPTGFLDSRHFQEIFQCLPEGTTELICHPGTVDEDLQRTPTRLLEQRERELQGILAIETKETLVRQGIRLISYAGLD